VGFDQTISAVVWAAISVPVLAQIGYRTKQALQRFWEGTSLLHAMRGEWFDSASCLATFSTCALKTQPEQVTTFRQTLLRLMSLCHGSALDEIKGSASENFEVLDITGLDDKTLRIMRDCIKNGFNRVEVILHMIQVLVIDAQQRGVISVPPPILSRVYQTLSRGFVNLLSAKKIKDTPYPFPYAQLIAVQVLCLAMFTPVVMSTVIPYPGWSVVCTFVPVFTVLCLNYTAQELEMPYGDDANDLPLAHFQQEMNSSLLMLIHEFSDHVPTTAAGANKTQNRDLSVALNKDRRSMHVAHLKTINTSADMHRQSLVSSNFSLLFDKELDLGDLDGPSEIPSEEHEEQPKMHITNSCVTLSNMVEEVPEPVQLIPTSIGLPDSTGGLTQKVRIDVDDITPLRLHPAPVNHRDDQASLPDNLVPEDTNINNNRSESSVDRQVSNGSKEEEDHGGGSTWRRTMEEVTVSGVTMEEEVPDPRVRPDKQSVVFQGQDWRSHHKRSLVS